MTPHLLAFASPLVTLVYLLTGPHPWFVALPWFALQFVWIWGDDRSGRVAPDVRPRAGWQESALLYALAALQLANVVLLARMIALGGFWRVDTIVAVNNLGMNSGQSAIIVAHELIHRRSRFARLVGRAVLCTVFYEHFATEHIRGHHVRVATGADPATARFGETLNAFVRRTIPGQLASAWRLDRRAVLVGALAEAAFAGALAVAFGPAALAVHLLHCAAAIRLLETVNYFEHWGLVRTGAKVRPVDSWDSESRLTFYMMLGLSRHADHHAHASRQFHALASHDESPKLPFGYPRMVWLAQTQNDRMRALLTAELERRSLGPFAA